jgi:hypothetical protein
MGLIGLKEHTVKGAKSIADAGTLPRNRDGIVAGNCVLP